MSDAAVRVEKHLNAVVVRFTNLRERNPLSVAVQIELDRILNDHGSAARALIFTGTADVFASGANLREIAALTSENAREFGLRGQRLMQKIADLPCLTIAAVNGFCFGGAFDLALACKIRVAAPNAVFAHPGANLGIVTGWGGTQRLPRLVGEAAALEMFLTAQQVNAAQALQLGLINRIGDDALQTAFEIAADV